MCVTTKQIEDVVLTIPMPKTVTNVNINPSGIYVYAYILCTYIIIVYLNTSAGVANYDPVGRVVNWNVSGMYNIYTCINAG